MPGSYDVFHDELGQIAIQVNNEGLSTLHNVFIDVVDLPKQSVSLNPAMLEVLEPGGSTDFSLSIDPEYVPPGSYTVNLRFISDETSENSSFLLNVKPSGTEADGGDIEKSKPIINSIIILLIVIIIACISILVVMFVLFKAKRCPLCGADLVKEYEGENYTSFKCSKCKYYSYKMKKKT